MIEQLALLWRFLAAQPPEQWVGLVSWHLLAVLAVLAVLSTFGLHFLLGYVFGFYRRKGKTTRWVAWPTLLVLLASLPSLLGAYLLAVGGPLLVQTNLTAGVTAGLGRMLLEPAYHTTALNSVHPDDVPKAAIQEALRLSSELTYRQGLESFLIDPSALPAVATPERGITGPDVLVQMGLRWVTAPHNTWLAPMRRGDQQPAVGTDEQPFFLPEFLLSLVDELPEGTALPRLDWEHVAGTRFVEGILRPLMMEYLGYLALALALAVLLTDGLYFAVMARLKRIGVPRPPKPSAKPVAKPTATPPAKPLPQLVPDPAAPAPPVLPPVPAVPPAVTDPTSAASDPASTAKPALPVPPAPPPPSPATPQAAPADTDDDKPAT